MAGPSPGTARRGVHEGAVRQGVPRVLPTGPAVHLSRRLPAVLLALLLAPVLAACGATHPAAKTPPALLSYLGQAQIGFGTRVDDTVVGGLSGITYDAARQLYYVISDDRAKDGPTRFYTVALSLSDNGTDNAVITGVHPLLDSSGHRFGPLKLSAKPPVVPPDPEGIAFDAARQRLYWSSEGERITGRKSVLLDPWVRIAGLDGSYQGQFPLPANLKMSTQRTGPRDNVALEGLTVTPDGGSLFAAMEDPGYNDGPVSDEHHQVLTRITKYDLNAPETTPAAAQYAYPIEPPERGADRNGLTDLVALSATEFLVVERSTSIPPQIRLYRAEIGPATDVSAMPSLQGATVTPMTKTLALDLSATIGIRGFLQNPIDNIEGITLGPKLPGGRQSVVLVSDNNFSALQITQFVLLAM